MINGGEGDNSTGRTEGIAAGVSVEKDVVVVVTASRIGDGPIEAGSWSIRLYVLLCSLLTKWIIIRCAATRKHSPDPASVMYVLARCAVNDTHSTLSRYRYEKQSIGNDVKGGKKATRMIPMEGIETNGEEDEIRTEESANGM